MSFAKRKTFVEEGDDVILYLMISKVYAIKAVPMIMSKRNKINKNQESVEVENVFQATPYGALRVRDLIGKRYGTKIHFTKGWGYILQPTPELWTLTLPHRTQIIYTPDISMIIAQLDICPGSIVIESGTGSASLSHALIRTVKPSGHLFTFDFHEERVLRAREEFISHGLGDYVTAGQRDVCENGFPDDLNQSVDAVFLDLPLPWLAIKHAMKSIKNTGGRLCSFSPCIEQVQKTCEELSKFEFQEIATLEVLQTEHRVHRRPLPVLQLDYLKKPKEEEEDGKKREKEVVEIVTSVPPRQMPGHTGYLTFATLLPVWSRKKDDDSSNCNEYIESENQHEFGSIEHFI